MLFKNDDDQKSQSDFVEEHGDPETCKNVDTLVDKLVKEIEEEVVNSAIEVRDTVRMDELPSSIPAALSVLGSQTQPDKVVDMATTQSSPLVAVLRHMFNDVEAILDDGIMLQDAGISKEVHQIDSDSNVKGGIRKQVEVQKDGYVWSPFSYQVCGVQSMEYRMVEGSSW